MPDKKDEKKKKPKFTFGPFEQALTVLLIMGFDYGGPGMPSITSIPLFTPPMIMLVIVAYLGYYLLTRQKAARERDKILAKVQSKSSSASSSSSKALSSSDVRSGKMQSSSSRTTGNPEPKQVSGKSSNDPRKDPSSSAFKNNFFLTMQGPGRPALVPFQSGLRPPKGSSEGTMWWNNVPEDVTDLMVPASDKKQARAITENPYLMHMVGQDIELLRLKKQQKEEEERYAKVASVMQTILGFLLCLVDMRLGVLAIIFFMWRHFTAEHERDIRDEEDAIEKEKKELERQIKDASLVATPTQQQEVKSLQNKLKRL